MLFVAEFPAIDRPAEHFFAHEEARFHDVAAQFRQADGHFERKRRIFMRVEQRGNVNNIDDGLKQRFVFHGCSLRGRLHCVNACRLESASYLLRQ